MKCHLGILFRPLAINETFLRAFPLIRVANPANAEAFLINQDVDIVELYMSNFYRLNHASLMRFPNRAAIQYRRAVARMASAWSSVPSAC